MLSKREEIMQRVYLANLLLPKYGLVTFTWGNVSEIDRQLGIVVIKPSGVDYEIMKVEDMVVTDLDGKVLEGHLKPSSDLETHIQLYKSFKDIKAIVHTHSSYATAFAQAKQDILCLGTTHADTFYGSVPCTRLLSSEEILENYEKNTGLIIVDELGQRGLNVVEMKAVLVASHGPFIWDSKDAIEAVYNAKVLEEIARMNFITMHINPEIKSIQQQLLDKHFLRKHGKNAYYGQ